MNSAKNNKITAKCLQIGVGFYDDYGAESWVKQAGKIKIIDQRLDFE